jgi:YVTN family beta-propeller protein
VFGLTSVFTGCSGTLGDNTFATGSSTVVASASGDALYAVNVDEGTVSRYEPATGEVSVVSVGLQPTRIARNRDHIFVTLRGERAVVVLTDSGGALSVVDRIAVDAEPVGIVASENGKRVYVANSLADTVSEIDGETFAVLRSWPVQGHPSWLALHPSGKALFVASAMGGRLSRVALDSDASGESAVAEVELPRVGGAGDDPDVDLTRRITGDLSISPDGRSLAIPALFVDNQTPIGTGTEEGGFDTASASSGGYGSTGLGISRLNPGVLVAPLDGSGGVDGAEAKPIFVAGTAPDPIDSTNTFTARSYLTNARYSPDGATIWTTMEGSHTVITLSADPIFAAQDSSTLNSFDTGAGASIFPSEGGFWQTPAVFTSVDDGPRGIAFLDDTPYVHSFLDRSIGPLRPKEAGNLLAQQGTDNFLGSALYRADGGAQIEAASMSDAAERGRRLFYSATSSHMSASGSGVSCATCHMDARNDGLTWPLSNGPRQTLNLASGIANQTAPFTWTNGVASVADEAMETSQTRMGGDSITDADVADIETFVGTLRAPDVAVIALDAEAVARGEALFNRADVGCAECHAAPLYTDNLSHDLYGLTGVNTPTLLGIAATAPYLHDGSAPTLQAVLETARAGKMGDASMLGDDELDDLEAYLRSL